MPHLPRVLLVGDSFQEHDTYALSFQRHGFCTLLAASASDAWRMADELPPAAVVADFRLTGQEDGLGLTRRLRENVALREVPVVILTGVVMPLGREMAARAGCDLLVPKPCLPDALSSVVVSLIRQRHATVGVAFTS